MAKNKIIKRCVLISVLAVAVVFSLIFAYYYFTTMSYQDCIDYCVEHTGRSATKFSRIGDGRYAEDYAYLVAADGDSSKAQEIFIFKKKHLGFIKLDRYKFIMSSTADSQEAKKFGAVQFFTNNDSGEKETQATLLCWGASQDSDIIRYEYTLTVREGSNIYSGYVMRSSDIWFVKFYGLNNADDNYKKVISDIKFYDSNDNLIDVY